MTDKYQTRAIVLEKPESVILADLELTPMTPIDVLVDMEWSGISTGTEKLLWTGKMPNFPGMGYPLVPGYESVGRVVKVGADSALKVGQRVFVPGAKCYGEIKGLFGGAASRVIVDSGRVIAIEDKLGEEAILFALAATGYHVTSGPGQEQPDLIIGHGVLGRLIARIAVAKGKRPVVWETDAGRREGAVGYDVIDPKDNQVKKYKTIVDVSGDARLVDTLIGCLAPGGEIVLAGFYDTISFSFPQAFMREARIRVAAEWKRPDLLAVNELVNNGQLSLKGLVTHVQTSHSATVAYETAFGDVSCLKMVLDWSAHA